MRVIRKRKRRAVLWIVFAVLLFAAICGTCSRTGTSGTSCPPLEEVQGSRKTENPVFLAQTLSGIDSFFRIDRLTFEENGVEYLVYTPLFRDDALNVLFSARTHRYLYENGSHFQKIALDFTYQASGDIYSFLYYADYYDNSGNCVSVRFALNYDTAKGKLLSLSDYFAEENYLPVLQAILEDDHVGDILSDNCDDLFVSSDIGIYLLLSGQTYLVPNRLLTGMSLTWINYQPVLNTLEKVVALTFDDGPHPTVTRKVVELLRKKGIKATFFVLGMNVKKYMDIVQLIADNGNEIGIHSYDHPNFHLMTAAQIKRQIDDTYDLVVQASAFQPVALRPPYGNLSREAARKVDKFVVNWSVDPEDWKYRDAKKVAQSVLGVVKSGDIVLMHDIYETSADAAAIIIDELLEQGYRFVTVSELFDLRNKSPDGQIYRHLTMN